MIQAILFSNSYHPIKKHAATYTDFLTVEQINFYRKIMGRSIHGKKIVYSSTRDLCFTEIL